MPIIYTRIECLKACVFAISKEETRYYLNGILVDNGVLVSTDGHRLAAIKPDSLACNWPPHESFILPREVIEKIVKVKGDVKHIPLWVKLDTDSKIATVIQAISSCIIETGDFSICASFPFEPVYGTYPEWQRVIPKAEKFIIKTYSEKSEFEKKTESSFENRVGFNTKYLADFQGFGKSAILYLHIQKGDPCVIRAQEHGLFDALGVLMPMRVDTPQEIIPEWAGKKEAPKAPPEAPESFSM